MSDDEPDPVARVREIADWIESEYPDDVGAQQSVIDLRRLADEVEASR